MINHPLLQRFFPFIAWFPINSVILRADMMAGITGALVLVPKAMAYAQLSGLPVYFGLYTAFVPAILGALWGSSRQLATGPVAIISLMTAAALMPIAIPFSDEYIGLALLLTLMVGVIQLALGVLKLGVIVNFISHPVILGFMNAAAIIIALSQLDLLLGIPKGRSDSFIRDIGEMLTHLPQTHLPTLAMSAFALALMLGLKKVSLLAKPSVLIAVIITTVASFTLGFAHQSKGTPDRIADEAIRHRVTNYAATQTHIQALSGEITTKSAQLRAAEKAGDRHAATELRYRIDLLRLETDGLEKQNKERLGNLRTLRFERENLPDKESAVLHLEGQAPAGLATDGQVWHLKKIENGKLTLSGGGDVVGLIPSGLPSFRMPTLSFDAVMQLFAAALIIALVAFMECVSMAKALAAQTKQRLEPNQELIGQGLANVGGAFFQSYPATGSFTGSAINLQAGAKTGFAMVFNGLFVAVTLLLLTEYLYFLPKATLGVIILLAVASLITPEAIKHTWKASKADGIVVGATFAITLLAAPHLEKGILFGAGLALALYLFRTMKPRVALLGRHPDGNLRDLAANPGLPHSESVIALRFDGRLYFANVSYFEEAVLEAAATHPKARYLLVVGDGINDLDASGEEVIHRVIERLRSVGVEVVFTGLKKQVRDVMAATGLDRYIGAECFYPNEDAALDALARLVGEEAVGPLRWTAVPSQSSAAEAPGKVGAATPV